MEVPEFAQYTAVTTGSHVLEPDARPGVGLGSEMHQFWWVGRDLPALREEPYAPLLDDFFQQVRTQPVWLPPPHLDVDTVRVAAPEGFAVEAVPEPRVVEAPFGRYERGVTVGADGRSLVFTRRFELLEHRLPPEAYAEVRAFFQAVARADAERVVFAPVVP